MERAFENESRDGHQPAGQAWDPFRLDVIDLLTQADQLDTQPIHYGSNHTFLVALNHRSAGQSLAVYKPARGEYPLYDFPAGTLYKREVATWLVDNLLGWHLIPPTAAGEGVYGPGSLQLFIEARAVGEVELHELRRLALVDLVLNNADRKSEHLLVSEGNKLWGIDHGLTFHALTKIRTVLWHFAESPIPDHEHRDLEKLASGLRKGAAPEVHQLRELLTSLEWSALVNRVDSLVVARHFPNPRYKPVPYRW